MENWKIVVDVPLNFVDHHQLLYLEAEECKQQNKKCICWVCRFEYRLRFPSGEKNLYAIFSLCLYTSLCHPFRMQLRTLGRDFADPADFFCFFRAQQNLLECNFPKENTAGVHQ